MRKRLFTSCLILLCALKTFAALEVRSKQIGITDGLANNTVRHIIQDSKGFIWLGTLNGLNRYDGNSFITYYPSSDNTLSLADRKVYGMEEDKNGFLWISFSSEQHSCYDLREAQFVDYTGCGELLEKYTNWTFTSNGDTWMWGETNGARQVKYRNNAFSSESFKRGEGGLSSNTINFVTEGGDGAVWIGTNKGLVRLKDEQRTVVDDKENLNHLAYHNGNTYFLTNNRVVFQYDKQAGTLVPRSQLPQHAGAVTGHFVLNDDWFILTTEGVYSYHFPGGEVKARADFFGGVLRSGNVLVDNKGNTWVFNHTGRAWYINMLTGKVKKFELIPGEKMGFIDYERYRVVHDSRDIIWISTYGNGLFAYDIHKDELSHFTAGMTAGLNHIGSDYLLAVMEDRSGEIWVSSEFSGVSRLTVINEGSYRYFPEDPSLLDRSNTIRMVSKINENEIWIGTRRGGLYVYDEKLRKEVARKEFRSNVYAVQKDGEGTVWMGTRGDGLIVGNRMYQHSSDPASLSNNNIFCVYRDRKDRMWIGTFGGGLDLAVKEGNKYVFRHFLNTSIGQRQVRHICEDKKGMIWVGTSDGVYVFNPETLMNNPTDYWHYGYGNGSLHSNEVKFLLADREGNIWIATAGAGFSICRPQEDYGALVFEHYDTKDGLSNDVVQSMAEDERGNIWIATEYGISKFIPGKSIFENYFFSAYSLGNVYAENAVCQFSNGNILFGSNHGFVVFNPNVVRKTSSSFPVVFTNLNVNGINVLPDDSDSPLKRSLAYSDELRLKHYQNSFVIDFSSFNFANAEETKYSYKLDDYDKEWSSPSSLNFAAYKMLPPGKYRLNVKSGNSSGIWNEDVSTLSIVITPPFYLTGWAFVVYAILILATLYGAFHIARNFNRLNNKIAVEKQLTEYKLVFFTNISHEFRTPLTLIQGALERIKRMKITSKELSYPLQTMEKSTGRMLRLIDQLLEFRKMQNNKLALSLEKTDVVAMLYEIFLSFEDMAESKNMDFQFVPAVTSYKMYIDKGKLDKIIYNLLSNAFKYTPQGGKVTLIVSINQEKNLLELQVSDTGVGIPKEKRGELFNRFMQSNFSGESVGIGLHLTLELVQVHKGNISYAENKGGGSVFTVLLPLGTEEYQEEDFLVPNNLLLQEQQKQIVYDSDEETIRKIIKPNPLNKQKLLVIEDDTDVRRYLKEELSAYFEVVVADNGIAGREMAQSESPDIIVCDVLMPGMNGFEVTRRLKTDFHTSHIPVILLTALGLPENHLEGIESGADAYISKPFSFRLLITRIVKLLEQRERLKEKFSEEPGILRSTIYASDRDKEFVDKFQQILEENLGNPRFTIDEFATLLNIGRTGFYKKVKGITGYSPNEYLRVMRMKKAAELLTTTKMSVSEVSYKVGIEDPFYFSKCFKTQFGKPPSNYQKGK